MSVTLRGISGGMDVIPPPLPSTRPAPTKATVVEADLVVVPVKDIEEPVEEPPFTIDAPTPSGPLIAPSSPSTTPINPVDDDGVPSSVEEEAKGGSIDDSASDDGNQNNYDTVASPTTTHKIEDDLQPTSSSHPPQSSAAYNNNNNASRTEDEEEEDPFDPSSNKYASSLSPIQPTGDSNNNNNDYDEYAASGAGGVVDCSMASVVSSSAASIMVDPSESFLLRTSQLQTPMRGLQPSSSSSRITNNNNPPSGRRVRNSNGITLILPPSEANTAPPAPLLRIVEQPPEEEEVDGIHEDDGNYSKQQVHPLQTTHPNQDDCNFETPKKQGGGGGDGGQPTTNTSWVLSPAWSTRKYAVHSLATPAHDADRFEVVPSPSCIVANHNHHDPTAVVGDDEILSRPRRCVTQIDRCHNNAAGSAIPMPQRPSLGMHLNHHPQPQQQHYHHNHNPPSSYDDDYESAPSIINNETPTTITTSTSDHHPLQQRRSHHHAAPSDDDEDDGPRLTHFGGPDATTTTSTTRRRLSPESAGKSMSPPSGGFHNNDNDNSPFNNDQPYDSVKFASPAASESPRLRFGDHHDEQRSARVAAWRNRAQSNDNSPTNHPEVPPPLSTMEASIHQHLITHEVEEDNGNGMGEEEPSAIYIANDNDSSFASPLPTLQQGGGVEQMDHHRNHSVAASEDEEYNATSRLLLKNLQTVPVETPPQENVQSAHQYPPHLPSNLSYDAPLKRKKQVAVVAAPSTVDDDDESVEVSDKSMKEEVGESSPLSESDNSSPAPRPKTFTIFDDELASDDGFFGIGNRPTALTDALTNTTDPLGIRAAKQKDIVKHHALKQYKKRQALWVKNGLQALHKHHNTTTAVRSSVEPTTENDDEAHLPSGLDLRSKINFTDDIALERIKQEDKERRRRESGGIAAQLLFSQPQNRGTTSTGISSKTRSRSASPSSGSAPLTDTAPLHFSPHKLTVCANADVVATRSISGDGGGRSVSLSIPFGEQPPIPSKRFFGGDVSEHPKSTNTATTTTYRASYGQQQHRSRGAESSSSSPRSHSQQQRSLSEAMVTLPPPSVSFQHAGMTITHHPHNRVTNTTTTSGTVVVSNERVEATAMAGSRLFAEEKASAPPPQPVRRTASRILTSPAFEEPTNENTIAPSTTSTYHPTTSLLAGLHKSTAASSSSHQPQLRRDTTTASSGVNNESQHQHLLPAATSGWGDQNISMSYAIRQRDALRPQTLNQQQRATTTATPTTLDSGGISSALSGSASGSVPRRRGEHRTIYAPF